jgi:threonine/homoserine/homoserine lactone efflux protein
METWLRGLALGFSIAAPVGPIGVLCIRRTLADGRLVGFVSGLGAATADMLYGAVAAFGLTAVAAVLTGQRVWLGLIGGVFLLYLGLRTITRTAPPTSPPAAEMGSGAAHDVSGREGSPSSSVVARPASPAAHHDKPSPAVEMAHERGWRLGGAYASTLGLTLTNPATILSFAAVFAGLGLASGTRGPATAAVLVAGVFCGSALWWLILSSGVSLLRRRVGPRALRGINVVSGVVLSAFGIAALLSTLL